MDDPTPRPKTAGKQNALHGAPDPKREPYLFIYLCKFTCRN